MDPAVEWNASLWASSTCIWQSLWLSFLMVRDLALYAKHGRRLRLTNSGQRQHGQRRLLIGRRYNVQIWVASKMNYIVSGGALNSYHSLGLHLSTNCAFTSKCILIRTVLYVWINTLVVWTLDLRSTSQGLVLSYRTVTAIGKLLAHMPVIKQCNLVARRRTGMPCDTPVPLSKIEDWHHSVTHVSCCVGKVFTFLSCNYYWVLFHIITIVMNRCYFCYELCQWMMKFRKCRLSEFSDAIIIVLNWHVSFSYALRHFVLYFHKMWIYNNCWMTEISDEFIALCC